jgi:hypothetical protein
MLVICPANPVFFAGEIPQVSTVAGGEPDGTAPGTTLVAYSTYDFAFINSKWGFIDKTGEVVIKPKYTRVEDFSEGFAAVKAGGTHFRDGKWGFIDRTGKEVIPPQYEWVRSFSEGLAAVRVDGKTGYIDPKGEFRIEPRPMVSYSFREGLAVYVDSESGKRGYIDRSGDVAIDAKFDHANWFGEGLAAVAIARPESATGEPPEMRYGFINRDGRIVIEPEFRYAGVFSEGLAVVKGFNGKNGYIDRDGNVVIPLQYYRCDPFRDGLGRVWTREGGAEKWGMVDRNGELVVEMDYAYDYGVIHFPDGTVKARYTQGGGSADVEVDMSRVRMVDGMVMIRDSTEMGAKHGFMDRNRRIVIEPRFEEVGSFHEGLARFAVDLDWDAVRNSSDPMGW